MTGVTDTHQLLLSILEKERMISQELQTLVEMKTLSSAGLTAIRQEMKSLKTQNENNLSPNSILQVIDISNNEEESNDANNNINKKQVKYKTTIPDYNDSIEMISAEYKTIDKKLTMLTLRRQNEQELRLAYQRKLARNKAIEEVQAKDPLNFRNQRKF